jgi:hypothetical protein
LKIGEQPHTGVENDERPLVAGAALGIGNRKQPFSPPAKFSTVGLQVASLHKGAISLAIDDCSKSRSLCSDFSRFELPAFHREL